MSEQHITVKNEGKCTTQKLEQNTSKLKPKGKTAYRTRTKLYHPEDALTCWSANEVGVFRQEFSLSSDDL